MADEDPRLCRAREQARVEHQKVSRSKLKIGKNILMILDNEQNS